MSQMINFPNLGIHWANVGQKITVLGLDITYYGMLIGAAILIGILLTTMNAVRTRQDAEDYLTLSIYLIVFGIIGARIYYLLFGFREFEGNLLQIFNLRAGGFAIYGAIIAGVITIVIFSGQKGMTCWKVLDTYVPAILIGQILGRIGDFFNREAFGEYTDGLFAMQLPIDSVRAVDVTDKMRQHIESVNGVDMIQVTPTFLYEAIWCLIILIVVTVYKNIQIYKGEVFLIYIIGYGVGRFVIEGMRVDKLRTLVLHLPVSQIVALLSVVMAGTLLYINYTNGEGAARRLQRLGKRRNKNRLKFK